MDSYFSTFFSNLSSGFQLVATPMGIGLVVVGLALGFIVGVIPGFGGPSAVAILLPFATLLGPANAAVLMLSIYAGTAFGGSIPAILLNIPGESGSAVVAIDGYPLAHSGRPHLAIGISRMASCVGGIIGVTFTILLIQPLSMVAIQIGPAELFVVALIAMVTCGSLVGDSVIRGLTAAMLGMLISMTGAGPISARPRLNFGILELYSGIPTIPAVLGLFAFAELIIISREIADQDKFQLNLSSGNKSGWGQRILSMLGLDQLGELLAGMRITLSHKMQLLQSSILGLLVGCIPGMGSSVAGFLSYGQAQGRSKEPETFGKGNPVGILAPEATDNAVSGGLLVPVLTLGIPSNATSAVLLAAFYLNGIQVGPQLLSQHADLAYGSLLATLFASFLILPLGILMAGPLIQFTKVRLEILIPIVLVLSVLGSYSSDNSMVSVAVGIVFGVVAAVLRLFDYPVIPMFLGFVLGPLTESSFVRALGLSQGDVSIFWDSTVSKVLLAGLAVIIFSSGRRMRKQSARRRAMAEATSS
jgi:putative tricarboxylic transport membrane protein